MLTLHVTNGDAAAGGLARSGLPGDTLAWRDVLHDGPVLRAENSDDFRAARAEFLASHYTVTVQDAFVDLEDRDARLDGVGPGDEVVLWFEPDLYDQLQLLQVLARLHARHPAERPTISIVPADLYLGPLDPRQFVPLFVARRVVRDIDLRHGMKAWAAFTAQAPDALLRAVDGLDAKVEGRMYASHDETRLPFLAAALRRQLEEYPDIDHGLSRTESQACEALAPGETTLGRLYAQSHHASESWTWLGDTTFAWYVQRLSDCSEPLITHANGLRVFAPRDRRDARTFWERPVKLTPFGHEVLRARADVVCRNGIDRWIGGAHLTTQHHWRWDSRTKRVVPSGE